MKNIKTNWIGLIYDKWNIEYNQSREFLDSVRNLWYRHESSSHPDIQSWAKRANLAIPFDSGGDNHDFTIATQAILIEVAKGYDHMSIAREAWLKAKHTKWPIDKPLHKCCSKMGGAIWGSGKPKTL